MWVQSAINPCFGPRGLSYHVYRDLYTTKVTLNSRYMDHEHVETLRLCLSLRSRHPALAEKVSRYRHPHTRSGELVRLAPKESEGAQKHESPSKLRSPSEAFEIPERGGGVFGRGLFAGGWFLNSYGLVHATSALPTQPRKKTSWLWLRETMST